MLFQSSNHTLYYQGVQDYWKLQNKKLRISSRTKKRQVCAQKKLATLTNYMRGLIPEWLAGYAAFTTKAFYSYIELREQGKLDCRMVHRRIEKKTTLLTMYNTYNESNTEQGN